MNCKLLLIKRAPNKQGERPVNISAGNGLNLYVPTGLTVNPKEWNARAQLCTGKNAARKNAALTAQLQRVENRILALRESGTLYTLPRTELRAVLFEAANGKTPTRNTLAELFRAVTPTKSPVTQKVFTQAFAAFSAVADLDALTPDNLTPAKLEEIERLLSPRLKPNTIALYFSKLAHVCNYALAEELCTRRPFSKFKIKTAPTAHRDLTLDELRAVAAFRGTRAQNLARDLFLLSFCLIGINTADLIALTPESIKRGRLEYTRAKTGKPYSILLQPAARLLIERIKKQRAAAPKHSNAHAITTGLNHHLSKIRPGLTMYYARHTWASLAFSIGTPRDVISDALGHSHGVAVTSIYIRPDLTHVDNANAALLARVFGEECEGLNG